MKKTKTQHTGVYRLEDGRWEVVAASRHPITGHVVTRRRRFDGSLTIGQAIDARERLAQDIRDEVAAGCPTTPTRAESVTDYAVRWLEGKAARVRPRVAAHYADVLERHVLPVIGSVPAEDVTRATVEAWVRHVEGRTLPDGRGYRRDTLHGWWRVVGNMLRDLAAEYDLPDPVRRVKPPRAGIATGAPVAPVRESRTLTLAQLARVLDQVRELHPGHWPQAYVCAFTGMRSGELRALRWEDIDRERRVLHIRRAVSGGDFDLPKTGDPREAVLTDGILAALDAHRRRMVTEQHPGLRSGLVFPGAHGGVQAMNTLLDVLTDASRAAGLTVRVGPQVLRRTFNSRLKDRGLSNTALQPQMGHTSDDMTERYYQGHHDVVAAAVRSLERDVVASAVATEGVCCHDPKHERP